MGKKGRRELASGKKARMFSIRNGVVSYMEDATSNAKAKRKRSCKRFRPADNWHTILGNVRSIR